MLSDRPLKYASGTGILLSRDVVEKIVNSRRLLTTSVDDVAIGDACKSLGFALHPMGRHRFTNSEEVAQFKASELKKWFLTRCKVEGDRRVDVEIMKRLHVTYLNRL